MSKPFKITKPGKYAVLKPGGVSHAIVDRIDPKAKMPAIGRLIWGGGRDSEDCWILSGQYYGEGISSELDIVGPYKEPKKDKEDFKWSTRAIRRRFIAVLRDRAPGLTEADYDAIVKAANLPKA
jgi:hypothetical protein